MLGNDKAFLDSRFMRNVEDARENGYELVCSECGAGIHDDNDMHDVSCSHFDEDEYEKQQVRSAR